MVTRQVSLWTRGDVPDAYSGAFEGDYARLVEMASDRLQLVRERESFAEHKLLNAEATVRKAQELLDVAKSLFDAAAQAWQCCVHAHDNYLFVGPKKRDLDDERRRAEKHAIALLGEQKRAESQLELCVAQAKRFALCVKAAQIGVAPAEWADAALSCIESMPTDKYTRAWDGYGQWEGSQAARRWCSRKDVRAEHLTCEPPPWLRLMDAVDDIGVPVGLAGILAAVRHCQRAREWEGPRPYCSRWHTTDVLDTVLSLLAVNHAFRQAVGSWVDAELRGTKFADYGSPRDEWPRGDDSHNGLHKPMHYDDSLLSYCEPSASYLTRTLMVARRELGAYQVRLITAEIETDVEQDLEPEEKKRQHQPYLDHLRQEHSRIAPLFIRGSQMECEVRAHALKRGHAVLTLSMRALAACHPGTARALPLRWPLRFISALAKVAMKRPRATIDQVAQGFVQVAAPGLTRGQQDYHALSGKVVAPKDQRVRVSNDGISAANAQRVMKVLLQHSPKTGWTVRRENLFLRGDVDDEALRSQWNLDAPSVILAANIVARISGKTGEPRSAATSPTGASGVRLWDVGHSCVFEDEVARIHQWEREKERLKRLGPGFRHLSPAEFMGRGQSPPTALPSALVCPVQMLSDAQQAQLRFSSADSSSSASSSTPALKLTLTNLTSSSPGPASPKRPQSGSAVGGSTRSLADGKRRKVVIDQRDGFQRLFKL